jgi:hypothetical protein
VVQRSSTISNFHQDVVCACANKVQVCITLYKALTEADSMNKLPSSRVSTAPSPENPVGCACLPREEKRAALCLILLVSYISPTIVMPGHVGMWSQSKQRAWQGGGHSSKGRAFLASCAQLPLIGRLPLAASFPFARIQQDQTAARCR